MADVGTAPLFQGLSELQITDVRKRAAEIGNRVMSQEMDSVGKIEAAVEAAARNLSFNSKHIVDALKDYARGFSVEMKTSLNDEVRVYLGLKPSDG